MTHRTRTARLLAGLALLALVLGLWSVTIGDRSGEVVPGLRSPQGPAPSSSSPGPFPTEPSSGRTARSEDATTDAPPTPQPSWADETLLHVYARDAASGAPIERGELSVVAADAGRPELDPRPLRLERPILGEVTTVSIPAASSFAVVVTVSAPGRFPSRVRVERPRMVGEVWQAHGRVERDVVVSLDASEPSAWLSGVVRVDGVPGIPSGLIVQARAQSERTRDAATALVDRMSARYHFAGEGGPWLGLWVTSLETVPHWIPFPEGEALPETLDLELERGRSLAVEVRRRPEGTPVAGIRVLAEVLVVGMRGAGRVDYEGQLTEHVSDRSGRFLVEGLPEVGTVFLREGSAPHDVLAELELEPTSERRLEWVLEVSHGPERADVHGSLPPGLDTEAEEPVQVRWSTDERRGTATLDEGGRWSHAMPLHVVHTYWVERDGLRLTNEVEVLAQTPRDVGPVTFQLRDLRPFRLSWVNAQEGSRLSVQLERAAVREAGPRLPSIGSEGSVELDVPADSALLIAVESPSGVRVERQLDRSTAASTVDLAAPSARTARVRVNGQPLEGGRSLLLHSLDEGGVVVARAPLDASGGTPPVALPSGRYYFRIAGRSESEVLCGVVPWQASPFGADILLDYTGSLRERPRLDAARSSGVVVQRLGDQDLRRIVPAPLRSFTFPSSPSADANHTATTWLCPDRSEFAPF